MEFKVKKKPLLNVNIMLALDRGKNMSSNKERNVYSFNASPKIIKKTRQNARNFFGRRKVNSSVYTVL